MCVTDEYLFDCLAVADHSCCPYRWYSKHNNSTWFSSYSKHTDKSVLSFLHSFRSIHARAKGASRHLSRSFLYLKGCLKLLWWLGTLMEWQRPYGHLGVIDSRYITIFSRRRHVTATFRQVYSDEIRMYSTRWMSLSKSFAAWSCIWLGNVQVLILLQNKYREGMRFPPAS